MNDPIEIADPRRKAHSFRHRIDQSIGAPPVGIGQAGRSRWYAVARGYDKLRGSSRVYLEAYIADWCDMHDLEVALGKLGALDRAAHPAFKVVQALRKSCIDRIKALETSLGRNV